MLSRPQYQCLVLLLFFVAISASDTFAKPIKIKWIGTTGLWSNHADWNLGVVPNNTPGKSYAVSINSVPFQTYVIVNTNNTIDSLFVAEHNRLDQIAGTFVTGSLVNHGAVNVDSTFIVKGNVVNTSGNFFTDPFNGISVNGPEGRLLVKGSVNNSGEIAAFGTGEVGGSGLISIMGTLHNSGRLDLVDGEVRIHEIVNTGTIQTHLPQNVNVINADSLTNSGTFDMQFGSFSDITNIGKINNLRNGTMFEISNLSSKKINNAGSLDILDVSFAPLAPPVIGHLDNSPTGIATINGFNFIIGSVRNAGTFSVNESPQSGSPDATINTFDNLRSGTFQLTGVANMKSLSNAGTTTVNANSILRTARLANLGNITISPTGQIIIGTGPDVIGGGLAQYTNGIWNEQLSPSSFGVVDVNGPMSLSGTLDIMLLNGFLPTAGETFTIANFTPGQLSGTWASILGLNFDHGLFFWDINYDNNNGEIILTAEQKLTPNDLSAVPEPATWIMMFSGIACWGVSLKARKQANQ